MARRIRVRSRTLVVAAAWSSAALTGCGKATDAAAPSTAKGGYASGKITRVDGRPIGIAGLKYNFGLSGVVARGENVNYSPMPAADGTWSTKLAPGIYHAPRGTVAVPFDGETFVYQLVPTADLGDTDAETGIAADFTWHVTGPTPMYAAKPDPANHTNWFGASCQLIWETNWQDPSGKIRQINTPPGTRFVFTASPTGTCIDGTPAKPITWNRTYDTLLGVTPAALNDMPPVTGTYHVTGKEVLPDGRERPMVIHPTTSDAAADAVDVKVTPAIWPSPNVCDGQMLRVSGPRD